LTALSAALENWEAIESRATAVFRVEIISIFYEFMPGELKEDF